MLTRGWQKDFSEPSEDMDVEASLHGCIHGVFRKVLLLDSPSPHGHIRGV